MKSSIPTICVTLVLLSASPLPNAAGQEEAARPGFKMSQADKVSVVIDKGSRITPKGSHNIVAQADTSGTPQENQEQKPAEVKREEPEVDESALRYFAAQGDKARLEAEIARLRALYPNWQPPADPLAIPENKDSSLEAMWKLYSEGKFEELREAIASRQTAEPNWKVPEDLIERLAVAEARQKLVAASNRGQYDIVVDIGAVTPSLLTCGDVDVLWRVAEAFAKTERPSRASDAYAYILDNCSNESERRATVMKALDLLDHDAVQALLAHERKLADGTGEFEALRDDIARRFVGEGGKNDRLVVDPAYLERLSALASKDGKPEDALLLGWYYIKRKDYPKAQPFFRMAYDKQDTAEAAQGLALTLIEDKNPEEAESVMYKWRNVSDEARNTYFAATENLLALKPAPVLAPDVLSRIARAVLDAHEPGTAQQFGWYALTFDQPRTAAQWFTKALQWKADYEPAAYGLAVARLRLEDLDGVAQIQKQWAGRSERIATLQDNEVERKRGKKEEDSQTATDENVVPRKKVRVETEIVDVETVPVKRRKIEVVTETARNAGCSRRGLDPATLSPGAALNRGWCLMRLNRPIEAAAAFEVALKSASQSAREDAAYGQSLAYLRVGLVNEAAVAATKAKLRLARATEVQRAVLAKRALDAFDSGRNREAILHLDQLAQLQTEKADLMVVRAYAYSRLGRKADALRIFEALAATGNHDAIKGLGELRAEMTPK